MNDKALDPIAPAALATFLPIPVADAVQIASALTRSGYFADVKNAEQALTKILWGATLGIPPVQAIQGVHIISQKPTLGANLIAAVIERSPQYDYQVVEHTAETCTIAFFRGGKERGRSTFTMADARAAKLDQKDTWRAYPKNMLFWRALSNGAKFYCAGLFLGAVYTPDELNAEVDAETGEIIDVTPVSASPPATTSATDDRAEQGRFWLTVKRLGYLDDDGKVDKRRVHAALGLDPADGQLRAWIDAGHSWQEATALLEELGPIQEDEEGDSADGSATCSDCGYTRDECSCADFVGSAGPAIPKEHPQQVEMIAAGRRYHP